MRLADTEPWPPIMHLFYAFYAKNIAKIIKFFGKHYSLNIPVLTINKLEIEMKMGTMTTNCD
jgi:hypothetical protein